MPSMPKTQEASYRRKLIEVALPLDAINAAAAREKSIRHGHPSTLHLWWARRPLAACRAVLFASLVDDPSSYLDDEDAAERERLRLFGIIERFVPWKASQDESILNEARLEIARSMERAGAPTLTDGLSAADVNAYLEKYAPPVLDPFCGGGSIPLEAQRLGLRARGGDINPVAVLITKALIEIPPLFAGTPAVNPAARKNGLNEGGWKGAQGLAADVHYYGNWMRDEAQKRIGHHYPKVSLPKEHGGGEATVIAWLWARTVICPNPACVCEMPLARSFILSKKDSKRAWIEPVVKPGKPPRVEFRVAGGSGTPPVGTVGRRGAICLACRAPVELEYVRREGRLGRMGAALTAVVADGPRGRLYLSASPAHEQAARVERPGGVADEDLPSEALGFRVQAYGMVKYRDLYTPRQLQALATFGDLVGEAMTIVHRDAAASTHLANNDTRLRDNGCGVRAYADAVGTMLGLCASKAAVFWTTGARWRAGEDKSAPAFGRQAVPMVWDYAEVNPFAGAGGDFAGIVDGAHKVLLGLRGECAGTVCQEDARYPRSSGTQLTISTDPPYYDNIGYADLSDFFYVWLRKSMGIDVWPELFSTVLTPKAAELIAAPYRHDGDSRKAKDFFEEGLNRAFSEMLNVHDERFPLCVFYAFKQSESDGDDDFDDLDKESAVVASTGWETMLEGLLRAGCGVVGTWPMRTEGAGRIRSRNSNALASSIALVCRPRDPRAPQASRRDFLRKLRAHLPTALRNLQSANIAPVDLAQAAIGPGMAVFSSYSQVLEEDGHAMSVRNALMLINQMLDEVLEEHDGAYDADSRWAVAWFEQHGMQESAYGEAETLARAKNTSVEGLRRAGIVESRVGKVRLKRRDELDPKWDPGRDDRITVWEVTHHLISAHEERGDAGAAQVARRVADKAEAARDLAYRLYLICERKKRSQLAQGYNALVVSWGEIARVAANDNGTLPLKLTSSSSPPSRKRSAGQKVARATGSRRR